MEISEGSDCEFWVDMDTLQMNSPLKTDTRALEPVSSLVDVIKSKIENQTSKSPLLEKPKPMNYEKEYYKDKIARIRESKDEEVKKYVIITKNHIKREYDAKFDDVKNKYKNDLIWIKNECITMAETVQNRDSMINFLCQIIGEIGIYVTNVRISRSNAKLIEKPETKPFNEENYIEQLHILSNQIDFLKETCIMYKSEIDKIKNKVNETKEICKKTENLLRTEIDKLNGILKQKDAEYDNKIKHFQAEFEKYKIEISLEHQVKDEIVGRQKVHIDGLRDELKNAKIVLQNRKLRMKFYEKLDDYVKDHTQSTSHKKNKSAVVSRDPSSKFRSREQSRCGNHRKRQSEIISPNTGVFNAKLCSPSFFAGEFNF